MAITNTDFAISAGGAITQVGGSTVYDVLDLHQWLQDLADNPSATLDDNVSILGANPSQLAGKRNAARPSALTLLPTITINQQVSQRFKFGSIEQGSGAEMWTGINTIGSGLAGRSHYVVQTNAKYNSGTKWWAAGPVRALFKVKTGSALVAGNTVAGTAQADGTVTVFCREWGYTYSHFDVDCSAGSEQVAALAVSADSNAVRLAGNYTGGTNTVTSTSPAFTVTLTPGTITRNFTGGASKTYKGEISFTGGVRLSEVWQALQWACSESSTATLNGVTGWQYRKLNTTYTENQAAPFGSLAGGTWFVAQGWWINLASLNALDLKTYSLLDDAGATITPPNNIGISVDSIVATDYVIVAKDNGSGGFANAKTTGLVDILATGTAAATTVNLSGTPTADVPAAGTVRIAGNLHTYGAIAGNTLTGLSPAIPAGGYASSAMFFTYIDKETTGTSEASPSFTYVADFTARVRVRNGKTTPIQPYETTFSVTAAGGSNSAIRALDL